jgi:hypothetical protein
VGDKLRKFKQDRQQEKHPFQPKRQQDWRMETEDDEDIRLDIKPEEQNGSQNKEA